MNIQGISNTLSTLPIASIGCAAAGLFIGRRFCTAAFLKAVSIAANSFGSKNASEWNEASEKSFTLAKKNGIRDLTAATSLIAIGLALRHTQEKSLPKEESGYFQNYGLPAGAVFVASSIIWKLKNYFQPIKDPITYSYKDGKVFSMTKTT